MMDLAPVSLGALMLGIAAVIGALASVYTSIMNTRRIKEIDHAVNGRPKGSKTLQGQVSDLHSDRPAPPAVPEELNGVAIKEMLQLLVADMTERRNAEND